MAHPQQTRARWTATKTIRKNVVLVVLLVAVSSGVFSLLYNGATSGLVLPLPAGRLTGQNDYLGDIYNDTIGFQRVFAVNLPERTDKRDTMVLQAKLTNITLEIRDGILGSEVSSKALPYTFDQSSGTVGSWRAHVNIFQKMTEENIASALILEDDADWDIGLKGQMAEFARGSRWLLNDSDKPTHSPYGDGWDILWIGHCHTKPNLTDNRRWVIPHDPTVPLEGDRWAFSPPDMSPWDRGPLADPQTRIVYVQEFGYCISGYALSLRGAERLLYGTGMVPFNSFLDARMGTMCSRGDFKDFTCIAPFPRLVGKTNPAGDSSRGSDIVDLSGEEDVRENSQSENVMFSVRQNIVRILNGESTFKSVFPNPSGNLLSLEQITSARGHPEHIDGNASPVNNSP